MNKCRIGSKFQLSSLSTMFCSVLTGTAAAVRCAVREEENEGSSPVEEGGQLEKTSPRMLGVVLWGW
jgi:hypothetical protein